MDLTSICLYIHMCMYTHVHRRAHTFVYLCVLIRINAYDCVFMCVFLFWEWVWNSSARIRECCGDHCCVLQNHDYFLSCIRCKSCLTRPRALFKRAVCQCVPADLCCLPPHGEKWVLRCFFGTCEGLPLLHLGLWKIPQPITAATKHRHFQIKQHLRNSAEDRGAGTHTCEKIMWRFS